MKAIKTSIILMAMLCITALELAALYKGIDGQLFTIVVAVIAGLAGLVLPSPIKLK